MRTCLSTRLPKQHAVLLNVFDNVASDYRNHQIMILSKLVDIVKACGPSLRFRSSQRSSVAFSVQLMLNNTLQKLGLLTGDWPRFVQPCPEFV